MGAFARPAIVFNGGKSRLRVEAFQRALSERLGLPLDAVVMRATRDPDDMPVQTRAVIADGADVLIAAGGDGTLLGVLRGGGGVDVPIAMLPLGTGNDYSRSLGIMDDAAAVAAIAGGNVRACDGIACRYVGMDGAPREELICSSGGLGCTAAIAGAEVHATVRALKRVFGDNAFPLVAAWMVVMFRGCRGRVVVDGRELDTGFCLAEVSKVSILGGMPVTPRAGPSTGRLDLCLFEGSVARRAQLLVSLQMGHRHVDWPDILHVADDPALNALGLANLQRVELHPERALPFHVHGEWIGTGPASFELRPGALRFVVP